MTQSYSKHLVFRFSHQNLGFADLVRSINMGKRRRGPDGQHEPEGEPSHDFRRPRKQRRSQIADSDEGRSLTAIRADIKHLTWELERVDSLPADVRVEKERQLANCHMELNVKLEQKKRQQMISKYHMVRFFGELNHVLGSMVV